MALKNPLSLAVDAALGTVSIAKMVVGQVGRTALSTAGKVVASVLERQEESGDDAPRPGDKPSSPPDLHTVPPVAVRVDTEAKQHGDPVAPARRTSPARKTAASNVDPASKQQGDPTAPEPGAGGHTSPAKKASAAAKPSPTAKRAATEAAATTAAPTKAAPTKAAPTKRPAPARTAAPGARKAAPRPRAATRKTTSAPASGPTPAPSAPLATPATGPVTATPADVAEVLNQSPTATKAATTKKAGAKRAGAKKAATTAAPSTPGLVSGESAEPTATKKAATKKAATKKAATKKAATKKSTAKKTAAAGSAATNAAATPSPAGDASPIDEPVSTPVEDTVVYSSESTNAPEHLAQPLLDPSLADAVRTELSPGGPGAAGEDADQS